MLEVAIRKVRPDKVDQLRRWMQELESRREEVLETFRQEGTRQEKAYLVHAASGPLLIYVMEAEDPGAARAAFQASNLPIDADHKRVMAEVLEGPAESEVLYEMRSPDP